MKKIQLCLIGILCTIFTSTIYAQNQPFYSWSTAHYQVYTDKSEIASLEISQKMEAALKLYNDLFHFSSSEFSSKFKVKIFTKQNDFNLYLQRLISETRSDFVFISYPDLDRNELVGFQREDEDFNASLIHYGFIQYLNAYIPHTPLWLEEGMATYLELSRYDSDSQSFTWQPNLIWLDSLKTIISDDSGKLSLFKLITMDMKDAQGSINLFYPAAWGLVHFLMNSSDQKFNRIIWDSISTLDAKLSLEENSKRVKERAFSWIEEDELKKYFKTYILSLKTFNDIIKEGVEQYSDNKIEQAKTSFSQALKLRSDNYIPHYYLGLISYEKKEYEKAYTYYNKAGDLGIDSGLINYALGVNAFADRQYDLAEEYLIKTRSIDAETYGEKVETLLKRIEFLK